MFWLLMIRMNSVVIGMYLWFILNYLVLDISMFRFIMSGIDYYVGLMVMMINVVRVILVVRLSSVCRFDFVEFMSVGYMFIRVLSGV